jgi:hypothetical protein
MKCRDYCPNEYWKGVFEELSFGKYPKQIYISGGMIQSSNKKKLSFCYSLKDKEPYQIVKDVIDLLTHHTDLISMDEIMKKRFVNERYIKDYWAQWKDIKRKHIKDVLLMEFCLELRKTYGWTMKKASDIFQNLSLRVYGGQIVDIKMKDRKIESIPGMQVNAQGVVEFDNTNEFRQELVHPLEDYIYHYCKRYVTRNSKTIE